ncbi:MAG: hypothetical protein J7M18_04375 [Candidatus Eremiobacteraeota bacterium]|nr:hypothetical protein [Candidatus Eremiobacteraeota bacterium]
MLKRAIIGIILVGLTVLLGLTGWGYIQFDSPASAASIMHIPVLLSTFLGGFPEGIASGLVYGAVSLKKFSGLKEWVHYPGRILMPILAGLIFLLVRHLLKKMPVLGDFIASLVGSAVGSLVNTWGVLGMGLLKGNFTRAQAMQIWAIHGWKEMLAALIIVPPLVVLLGMLLRKFGIRQ